MKLILERGSTDGKIIYCFMYQHVYFIVLNHLFWAVTPRNRAQSAPPSRSGRTGHDLYMTAVKHREIGQ